MYDAYMERSGEDGYDSNGEEIEEEEWSSVTGYVCTGGHLLLGLFGDSKPTAGNLVPNSGKGLEIEQGIVKFLADEMTERQGDLSEGARFVEGLALDHLSGAKNGAGDVPVADRFPSITVSFAQVEVRL
jgi:hypothetical protein